MATWPAGIEIGDSRIAAGEPITEDLMKDYRDRDDECLDYIQASAGYQNWVAQAHLKSSTEEQSIAAGAIPGVLIFVNVGEYGFYPRVHSSSDAGGSDMSIGVDLGINYGVNSLAYVTQVYVSGGAGANPTYAKIRYVQASRNEPVVWIKRDKANSEILGLHFDPECIGFGQIFDPDLHELFCLQLKNNKAFCKKLFKDYHHSGDSFLMQVQSALDSGALTLKGSAQPRLPKTDEAHEKMKAGGMLAPYLISKSGAAPALYAPDVRLVDFHYDPTREVKP